MNLVNLKACLILLSSLLSPLLLDGFGRPQHAWSQPAPPQASLSSKEIFMLMFGKGNGAMRALCALERDGVISAAQRRHYSDALLPGLMEAADDATARRNIRIGMAFADGRKSLCQQSIFSNGKEAS